MIAIKQLGTNGGGFFNSNSAVPFENPNGLTNFLEVIAILLIPAAQVFMFGKMVLARRHAWMVFAAMFAMFAVGVAIALPSEQHGSQVLRASGVNITQGHGQSGGNMADKEVRFGIANTALWATATTDASNGSVNGGHDALTAVGRRRPARQHLRRRGDLRRGRLRALRDVLLHPDRRLRRRPDGRANTGVPRQEDRGAGDQVRRRRRAVRPDDGADADRAVSVVTHSGLASVYNPGAHGFTEALYAYTSQTNNNGSAFAGYGATSFSAYFGAIAMLLGRFAPLLAALAIGGSLAAKKTAPVSAGTFRTDGPTFVVLLVGVIVLTAGLMVFPALTLGPIVEGLTPLMLRDFKASIVAVVVITVVFGLGLPALFTGFAQVAFKHQANGSLINVDGKIVGSRLVAQAFTKPQYFHERPSATAPPYNGDGTTFANLGPTSPDLAKAVKEQAAAILKLEGPYNPGLTIHADPGRRGDHLRLRRRPRYLARQCAPAVAADCCRTPPLACDRPGDSSSTTPTAAHSASSASPGSTSSS